MIGLDQLGLRLGLITNGNGPAQRAKIDRFGLAKLFHHVLIEGEFGCGKPDPRVYLTSMNALGCRPSNTWMVGDNLEWEVAAPQQLGLTAIWVDPSGHGLPLGTSIRPSSIIPVRNRSAATRAQCNETQMNRVVSIFPPEVGCTYKERDP